jgi:hypothetical protein
VEELLLEGAESREKLGSSQRQKEPEMLEQ